MERYCNRCGKQVKKETEKTKDNYPYYCPNCDENMFEFETHTKKQKDNRTYYERNKEEIKAK